MTWNRDDVAAGLVFLGLGLLIGGYTLATLPVGATAEMGPGFFPLALCIILALLGAAILAQAHRSASEEPARPPINPRAVVFIVMAPIAFGLSLRSLGLVPALVIAVGLAVAASRAIGVWRGAATVLGMTLFCVGVFYYGLRVPVALFNLDFLR